MYEPGVEAEILSDVERRGGNAAPASQVFAHKKLEVFFFFIFFLNLYVKSTIIRKQSRVKYVRARQVAELCPGDLPVFFSSLPNKRSFFSSS